MAYLAAPVINGTAMGVDNVAQLASALFTPPVPLTSHIPVLVSPTAAMLREETGGGGGGGPSGQDINGYGYSHSG